MNKYAFRVFFFILAQQPMSVLSRPDLYYLFLLTLAHWRNNVRLDVTRSFAICHVRFILPPFLCFPPLLNALNPPVIHEQPCVSIRLHETAPVLPKSNTRRSKWAGLGDDRSSLGRFCGESICQRVKRSPMCGEGAREVLVVCGFPGR